jgi:glycosyltransferase involved in cell wall biosynthesis
MAARREPQILHICPLPLYSGLEQYALKLALEESARGFQVGFVVLAGSELEAHCLGEPSLKTYVVDFNWKSSLWKSSLWKASTQYRDILMQAPGAQVVHLHSSQDIDRLGLALLRCRLAGQPRSPKVIQQNHLWISHSKKDPAHWLTHKVLDEVWCSSSRAKQDLVRFLPVPQSKLHIVPYGRDLKIVENFATRVDARRELNLPESAVVLGAIARIDRGKGVWELLNASVELIQRGLDFYLVIIGGPTLSDPVAVAFADQVDEFVGDLTPEIKERIRLTGAIPNAGHLLRAFDLYAQVAYKETFSLALLDAQLAELPVVGTESGGTPEVVRQNETGWLAAPESVLSLKEAISQALSDRARWPEFGRAARSRVERDYDINVVVPLILNRYGFAEKGQVHSGLR